MEWINKWKLFVSGSGELPGPIDNLNLYKPSIQSKGVYTLRIDLCRNKDYKMANEFVWNILYGIYGGGPVIMRLEKDIYSK